MFAYTIIYSSVANNIQSHWDPMNPLRPPLIVTTASTHISRYFVQYKHQHLYAVEVTVCRSASSLFSSNRVETKLDKFLVNRYCITADSYILAKRWMDKFGNYLYVWVSPGFFKHRRLFLFKNSWIFRLHKVPIGTQITLKLDRLTFATDIFLISIVKAARNVDLLAYVHTV